MNSYALRNFRVFGSEGGAISLAPLTILTGCNSSGKSSFTKSIKLVQPMLEHLGKDLRRGIFHGFTDYYTNFAFGTHKLGSFEKTINWLSNDDEFTFEYVAEVMALNGRQVNVAVTMYPLHETPKSTQESSVWQVEQVESDFEDKPHRLNRNRQYVFAGIRRIIIKDVESQQIIYEYHHGKEREERATLYNTPLLNDCMKAFSENAEDAMHSVCRMRTSSAYKKFRFQNYLTEETPLGEIQTTWGTRADSGDETRNAVGGYAELVCTEALCACEDITNATFIEIDRSNLQRIYLYENQGTSFNHNLESYLQLLDVISVESTGGAYVKGTFVNKWLKKLLNAQLMFEPAPEGIGIYIYLVKTVNKRKIKVSLADVGYGITPLIAMLVRIEMEICKYVSMAGSDYGRYNAATLYIEEPESNLHPNFQSLLADIFADAVRNYPVRFVFETHSEYFVRKFQVLVASRQLDASSVVLNYLYDPDPKKRPATEPQVKVINIKENGGLTGRFGTGFFDESTRLSTELFK